MGDVGPEDATQLAAAEDDTRSVRAWGLDDVVDYPPTRQFATPGRITGLAVGVSLVLAVIAVAVGVWQLRAPAAAPPPAPTTAKSWPTWTAKAPPPVTVTVAAPAPTAAPDYDQMFLDKMLSLGWKMTDPALAISTAHKVCDAHRQGYSNDWVNQRVMADTPGMDISMAITFTGAIMATYPNCP